MAKNEKIRTVPVEAVRDVDEIDEDAPASERLEAAIDEAIDYIREELMPALEANTQAVIGNTQAIGVLIEKVSGLANLGNVARIFKRP